MVARARANGEGEAEEAGTSPSADGRGPLAVALETVGQGVQLGQGEEREPAQADCER